MKLKDKVVLITGASSGLGKETANLFAKEGARVVAVARRMAKLEELVDETKDFEGEIVAFEGDVGKGQDIKDMVKFTLEKFGKVDILINNAGIIDGHMPAGEMTDEMWDNVLNINLTAPLKLTRAVLPNMIDNGKGNIINISSVGGLNGGRGGAAYVSTKHALIGLTKNTGFVYADKGIRCNAICPGTVPTGIGQSGDTSELGLSKIMSGFGNTPRMGTTTEIANILLFLASDESSLINGVAITADAGWTAY
nr:SDR family NAD(P)-dependent oxidoreductase [Tissierella sp.]